MAYSVSQFQATHLLQGVYERLEQSKSLLATGGSTTTLIDTTINSSYLDNAFLNYTAFVSRDGGGAGASPEGEFRRVSAYTASTTTLTVPTAFSAAIASGDVVTIARGSLYPLQDVIRICNATLKKKGAVRQVDTSLTTANDQTEYTVPIGLKNRVYDVAILSNEDSNDNQPKKVDFDWKPNAEGSTETLMLREQPDSGWTIWLYWEGEQADLFDYDDPISEYINRQNAIAECALAVAEWKSNINPDLIPKLRSNMAEASVLAPVKKPVKRVRGFVHWSP